MTKVFGNIIQVDLVVTCFPMLAQVKQIEKVIICLEILS